MKVRFSLTVGSFHTEEIVDLPKGIKEEEIDESYADWRSNYLDGSWTVINEPCPCCDGRGMSCPECDQ
jgi:hypothetical protein